MDRHTRTVDGAAGHADRAGWADAVRNGEPEGPEPRDYMEERYPDEHTVPFEPGFHVEILLVRLNDNEVIDESIAWFKHEDRANEHYQQVRRARSLIGTGELTIDE